MKVKYVDIHDAIIIIGNLEAEAELINLWTLVEPQGGMRKRIG